MSTHIDAPKGAIADVVLLPGDPLRAQYIAENFLDNAQRYNTVRNAFGFTGTFEGRRVSVQATGMGIPSISIYVNELIQDYGVKTLIRVGTAGGMGENVKVRDVVLAQGSSTDSSIILNTFGAGLYFAPLADFNLLRKAANLADTSAIRYHVGNVLGEDRFYNDEMDRQKLIDYEVLATEMETPALYLLAAKYHVHALSILTVSNHLVTGEETSAQERQTSFNDMIGLALGVAKTVPDR
ncbi:purine-nucleoside phosphorylase [Lacticaseibacillus paracasei]|uniref:Purine nucleoside phosphorylase DeoD-type n=2 Tax=Lacticaseibacillus paracasei subsp. paracasei TaxID=47714 RepID=A0A829H8L5_LACPA|nr:purine-nucleoside phosphorylase [Lacticaseibacillus paracasei]EPC33760.1 Purine nucleoside phosphorylase [Lacticaseibacillus paracasei subsp. paracasei Lpp22]EPC74103.1 purine nucleoside phosphorylase [Lacticaseibacillus paracasei subsp. paracasei Lpp41]ATH00250.1 purine-nucleoside phosphorylase [Lacticaseibacillus paracasei]MBB1168482.1 purine-nucleoside phosphorylase [Lacticaseibacillus paracasei]MBU6045377.1 purine-nucleoside phosphorylase [Lacticaseibacillus paracasei]